MFCSRELKVHLSSVCSGQMMLEGHSVNVTEDGTQHLDALTLKASVKQSLVAEALMLQVKQYARES